jgi:hypothetical protein
MIDYTILYKRYRNLFIVAVVLLIFGTLLGVYYSLKYSNVNNRYSEITDINIAINDSLTSTINKLGQIESSIDIITTENTKTFLQLKSKDLTILNLQKQVEFYKSKLKGGSSVTTVGSNTSISTTIPTEIDLTQLQPDCDSTFPIYRANIIQFGDWITGTIIARRDSTKLDNFNIKHDLTIVISKEKVGLFKSKPVAIVTDKNPYNKINSLVSYQVTVPKRMWVRTLLIGIGTGIVTTVYLLK